MMLGGLGGCWGLSLKLEPTRYRIPDEACEWLMKCFNALTGNKVKFEGT